MKKKSSRIHVSKVESARDTVIRKQSSLKSIEIQQREMKRPSTARSKYQTFIPPLKLLPTTISKIEKTTTPESMTVRFLTEPSKYSDPISITSFLATNNFSKKEEENAKKIQKAWRKMKDNKKTRSFLYFAFLLYKTRMKFPVHLWLLSKRFPASKSKPHYEIVVNYMKSRHYLYKIDDKWLTSDFKFRLLSFDQYCKTNCFLIGVNFDVDKIINFVKILMKPLILEALKTWQQMIETSTILKKQNPKIRITFNYRSNFKEIFWTFYFWRRWSHYKKTKNIEQSSNISESIYLLEWNIFRAKKIQKKNIIHKAFCMRDDRLQLYAFLTMRKYCLQKIKQRKEFNKINKVANKHLMSITFRSFIFYHVQCSIEKSLKYRVLSSWYKISDKSVLTRSCLIAMKNRRNIRLMIKTVSKWKYGIYENSLYSAFLFDSVLNNSIMALKIGFLLLKDFIHYQFVFSFIKWKKLISMKKRAKMFVTWSFYYSKENAIKSYLIDLFRENCLRTVDYLNYFPFKSELDKKFTGINYSNADRAPIALKKRKSKLAKLIQSIQNTDIPMNSFKSTVNDALFSFQKIESFQCYEDDFCQKATSDQIKNMFYHIVIIKSYLNKGKFMFRTNKFGHNVEKIKEFRDKNNLLTIANVRRFRLKQESIFEIKRKAMIQKLNRDSLLLAKKDVCLALIALNKINPQFTIEPPKTFEESEIIKEGETISPSSSTSINSTDDVEELKIIKRRQKHPFLNPIPTLKDGINKTNRKQRRPHKQLFTEETNQSAKNRAFRIVPENGMMKGNRNKHEENIIIYEKHQNLSRENKEKYLLEKKRKEKEQLKNMPPPLEKMPTIKNSIPLRNTKKEENIFSSHLEITNDSLSKFMSSQDIDLSKTFISKSKARLKTIKENNQFEEEEEEEEANDINEIDEMISKIEKISFPYLNNENYLNQTSIKRRDFLTNKYFSILDILLKKQKRPKIKKNLTKFIEEEELNEEDEEESFELPQSCVSRVLRALMPRRTVEKKTKRHRSKQSQFKSKTKLKRKPLFQDRGKAFEKFIGEDGTVYHKSRDSEFSNVLFLGDKFMTKLNLSGKLPNQNQYNEKDEISKNKNKDEEEEEEEENMSSTFDVPGFNLLLTEVENFLKSGKYFELSIDEQERRMIENKEEIGNNEKVMLIMNKLAREAIKSETSQDQLVVNDTNDEDFVSVANHNSYESSSSQSSRSIKQNQDDKKLPTTKIKLNNHFEFKSTKDKRIRRQQRKLKAESPIIIKNKFTFTQDLLNSIHEGSRIAHNLVLNYYNDLSKIDPFEGLDTLKRNIKLILKNSDSDENDSYSYYSTDKSDRDRKEEIIQRAFQLCSPYPHQNVKQTTKKKKNEVYAEELILSIGQKPSQKLASKNRKSGTVVKNKSRSIISHLHNSEVQKDLIKVENLKFYDKRQQERPKSSWETVKQDVKIDDKMINNEFSISNLKIPVKNLPKKPKSHATKMTASSPIESPEFSVIQKTDDRKNSIDFDGLNRKSRTEKVKRIKNPKWIIESDPEITNDDIEFFLFATPFIIPPAIINNAIEKKK